MEKRIRAYVDRKFFRYPKTKEIVELREELYSMMRDKYEDCKSSGLTDEESYRQTLTIMNDFKSAIKEVETGSSLGALRKKLASFLAFSAFYFIALTCVYLYASMVSLQSFKGTWLIGVDGAFAYLVFVAVNMLGYAKMFDMKILSRCSLGVLFISFIPLIYVFPNLILAELYGEIFWAYSWLAIPILVFAYMLADLIMFGRKMPRLFFGIELALTGLVLTTAVYLSVAFLCHLWSIAWIVYVIYLSIVSLAFYINEKIRNQ